MTTKIAVLGIGAIGGAMARNLLEAGFDVRAWNRTRAKAEALAADGATVAATPGEAVAEADVVLTTLFDAAAVREVMEEAAEALRPGSIWAEHSTIGVADVAGLAALAEERDVTFVDAPVQGARPLAEQGQLLIYAAGPEEAKAALEPVFSALGRRTDWLSTEAGSTAATATKLVVNGFVFALTTAAAEAVALARGLGVDPQAFPAAIAGGPLDSPWAQLKAAAAIEENFASLFPVDAGAKDSELIRAAAEAAGVRLDVADAVGERFERAAAEGHGQKDIVATYLASFSS